jgi:hypothetical protein
MLLTEGERNGQTYWNIKVEGSILKQHVAIKVSFWTGFAVSGRIGGFRKIDCRRGDNGRNITFCIKTVFFFVI